MIAARRTLLSSALALGLGLFAFAGEASAQAAKIAVVNPQKIFAEMKETKALQGKMNEDRVNFEKTKNEKVDGIKDLRTRRHALNPQHPQFQDLNDKLMEASVQLKVWGDSQQLIAEAKQKRQMKTLFEKIEAAVAVVAQREGFDLVLSDTRDPLPQDLDQITFPQLRGAILSRHVLYAGKNVDISDKVLTELDAKFQADAAGGNK